MDVTLLSQIPSIKIIFFAHLVPLVWSTQVNWLPIGYTSYNLLLLISLLWCIHAKDSEDAIFMATFIDLVAIILDAIIIGRYYGSGGASGFSVFMAIVNLLLRPISALILLKFYNERTGRYNDFGIPGFMSVPQSGSRSSYEDLDGQGGGPSVPRTLIDTGSPRREGP